MWEFNPMGGGRIVRDKLWFYLTYREVVRREHRSRHVLQQERRRSDEVARRLRHDASGVRRQRDQERHRATHLAGLAAQQIQSEPLPAVPTDRTRTGAVAAPREHRRRRACDSTRRASFRRRPGRRPSRTVCSSRPAGATTSRATPTLAPRVDGTHNPDLISVLEQCSAGCANRSAAIAGLIYRFNLPLQQGFERHQIGTMAQMRASASYIPGSHSLKFGYQGNISHPSQAYFNITPFIQYRFNNGVPNQLNQTAVYPGHGEAPAQHPHDVVLRAGHLHARAADASGRHSLRRHRDRLPRHRSRAVRTTSSMPTRLFWPAGTTDEIHWKDITPRIGAAYDLFGNGKTAIKVNVGKYLTALTASNSDLDLQPLIRIALAARRGRGTTRLYPAGDPRRGNYVPDCDLRQSGANGECGAMDNQNFGKEIFTKSFDPDLIHGWGKRTYNWEMGISVQQELLPRVGLTVGYFRRWFGNFYTANNRLTTTADYTPFSIPIPADPRLPGGGGGTVHRAVQPRAEQGRPGGSVLAALLELRRDDRDLARRGRQRQRAAAQRSDRAGRHELGPAAPGQLRRESGVARDLQLGEHVGRADRRGSLTSTGAIGQPVLPRGRTVLHADLVPRARHLHRAEDRSCRSAARGEATPGPSSRPTTSSPTRSRCPSLGRNLSSGNVTVNLVEPGTLYGARRTTSTCASRRSSASERTRAQFGVDIYNLLNTDVVTLYNNGYSPTGAWLTPTAILPARYARLNMQFDF